MRRAFGYAGVWLAATSVAVTVSWFGCAVVLNGTSPPAPEVLSSMRGRHVAGLPNELGTTTVTPQATDETLARQPAPSGTTEPRTSRSGWPNPTAARVSTTTRHATPPPLRTPPPPRPTGSAPSGPSIATSPDNSAGERTYDMIGGSATVRFTAANVQVVGLEPKAGYQWYVDQPGPTELWVIFTGAGQESDLYATWDRGPSANVIEYWW